eukprot:1735526-Prymnesium_polylepis.2
MLAGRGGNDQEAATKADARRASVPRNWSQSSNLDLGSCPDTEAARMFDLGTKDVDDLEDIANIGQHITESAATLMFLSKGCMLQGFQLWLSDSTPAERIDLWSEPLCDRLCVAKLSARGVFDAQQEETVHPGARTGGSQGWCTTRCDSAGAPQPRATQPDLHRRAANH